MPTTPPPHIISASGGPEGLPAKIQIPTPDMTVAEMKASSPAVKPILPEAVLPDVGPPKQVLVADRTGNPDWEAMADRSRDVAEMLGILRQYNDYGIQSTDQRRMRQEILSRLNNISEKQLKQYKEPLYGRVREILAVTSAQNESLGLPYGPNSEREFLVEVSLKLKDHTFLYEAVGLIQKGLLDTSSRVALKDHDGCANLLLRVADMNDDPFIGGRAERALVDYIAGVSSSGIVMDTQKTVLNRFQESLIRRKANYRAESLISALSDKATSLVASQDFLNPDQYYHIYSTIKALGEALPDIRHRAASYLLGFAESKTRATKDIPSYAMKRFIENATGLIKQLDPERKLIFVNRFADMLGTNFYRYEGNGSDIAQALADIAFSEGDQVDANNAVVSEVHRVLQDRAILDVDLFQARMTDYQRERTESARIALGKLEYKYPFLKATQDVPVASLAGETVDVRT